MSDERAGGAPRPSLRGAVARFADSAIALARTRAEIAAVEFAEERVRLTRSAMLIGGAVAMLAFAIFGVAAWIVVYFWDTHRLTAIAGVTLAFIVAGGVMLWRNSAIWRGAPPPFSQTLAEFEKDRAWLRGESGMEPPQ